MSVAIQVIVSILLVAAVLWFMWRMPRGNESLYGWAPPLALGSAWAGLAAVLLTALLWVVSVPDRWLPAVFIVLDPFAIGAGVLVLWIYRGHDASNETIEAQQVQAKVGIALGIVAVALGYVYVMTHKTPFTPVGS